MKSIYLAARFTSALQNDTFNFEFKNRLLQIINYLKNKGHEVFSAHLKENFGNIKCLPDEFVVRDFNDIKNCEYFIALIDEHFSGGVFIELGWASILKKKIIILIPVSMNKNEVTPVISGLQYLTACVISKYQDMDHLIKIIDELLGQDETKT